jgi:hypothetical protein
LRQQRIELAVPHQRLAADQRHVQRLQPLDDLDDAVDERAALAIRQRAQRVAAAEMLIAVRVTTRTAERALAGDFDGEIGAVSGKNLAPGSDDAFHVFFLPWMQAR